MSDPRDGAEMCVSCENNPKPPNVPCETCGRDTRTARERFDKGQRVRATPDAYENGATSEPNTFGTVVGFGRKNPYEVRVVLDGQVTPANWHVTFWEPT